MLVRHHDCNFLTFEEATQRFIELSELYSHLDTVTLSYYKGDFLITYSTYEYSREEHE